MNRGISLVSILLLFALSGCETDERPPIPAIDGFALYWDHEVFGEGGRRLRFEFSTTNAFYNKHELVFNYAIDGNSITAALSKSIDHGKCPYFPTPSVGDRDPNKCTASGGFFIPDEELDNGEYTLTIVTPDFEVTSALSVTGDQVTLSAPENDHLITSIEHVYPIPENILFGSVVFEGEGGKEQANILFENMIRSGLTETSLPDYHYRHLNVDEMGHAIESHWEPDNHSLGFLYRMEVDFKSVLELATEHFHSTNLNIYLYTSNGDQARMNQSEGITVVFGDY